MTDISLDRLTSDLATLLSIRSESPWENPPRIGFREREVADWLNAQMRQLGLEIHEAEVHPGRPNIWGYRRGSGGGPTLMLCAHMDTVGVDGYHGDPFEPKIIDNRLHGRGSCDMKAAIACFLETVRSLANEHLRGDLLLLFVCDEEYAMTGSIHAGRHGPSADFAIIGEPSRLAICPKHKGELCGRISVKGRAAHTSMPENGRSAILDMMAIIHLIDTHNSNLKSGEPHDLCGTGRSTVSTIQGGTAVSSVPDFCQIEFDRRSLPGESRTALLDEFQAIIDRAQSDRPGLQAQIEPDAIFMPPLDTAIDATITQSAIKAVQTVLGQNARIEAFPGSTDAPHLGIEAIILGPGDLAQAHTINEWIDLDQLPKATAIYREIAMDLLR